MIARTDLGAAARSIGVCLAVGLLLFDGGGAAVAESASVVVLRVPDGGRLPRAVIDDAGTVHVVYVVGDWRGTDLLYVTRTPGASTWSDPVRLNREPGTVVGSGPIDGGQLALGEDNRLHVAWFQKGPIEFFYTRTTEDGIRFEPQLRVGAGAGVEAGPSIATDRAGNVFLFWHAGAGEDAGRSVYMAVSRDDGTTFEPARPVNQTAAGACNCCGLHALSDAAGTVYLSYRGAGANIRRGQRLLTSRDAGRTFTDDLIQPWELGACPVSTTTLSEGPSETTVAWETEGQVYFTGVDQREMNVSPAGKAEAFRQHPAVAANQRGETLLVWVEGAGLRSGGAVRWQLFDADGQPTSDESPGTETFPKLFRPAACRPPSPEPTARSSSSSKPVT